MIKRSILLSLLLIAGGLHAQDRTPDLDKAKEIATTVCVACHSVDGNSPLPDNPKIAGQVPEYLYKQMLDFSSIDGEEAARPSAIMAGMVAGLSDDDMYSLAHYYAQQTPEHGVAKNDESVEFGRKVWRGGIVEKGVPACAACHGASGSGMPAQYPALAGQHAEYTLSQLQAFRDDGRANDPVEMMRMIALKMTDKEMAAVADYAAGMRHIDD